MPRIKDVKPHLKQIGNTIKNIDGVNEVYVWGSVANNIRKSNFRVKDVDIIVKTSFNSGDLVSIDNQIINRICTDDYLLRVGYDPSSIKFSKEYINLTKHNIDHWAISCDKKLLHWGPIITNKRESEDMNEEAEKYAIGRTGLNRNKINRLSEKVRKNWYNHYQKYLSRYFSDMPTGWYQSAEVHVMTLLKGAKKI